MGAVDMVPWDDDAPAVTPTPRPAGAVLSNAPARTLRDYEAMIGVDAIDVLHADRRAHLEELAPLEALYGPGGTFDARRKAFRSLIANEIAVRLTQERGKAPAETELERLAAGDPRVVAWLDAAEENMARYHLLKHEVQCLNELVNRGQSVIRFAASEPRA